MNDFENFQIDIEIRVGEIEAELDRLLARKYEAELLWGAPEQQRLKELEAERQKLLEVL